MLLSVCCCIIVFLGHTGRTREGERSWRVVSHGPATTLAGQLPSLAGFAPQREEGGRYLLPSR